MITSLYIKNFKSLKEIDLEMRHLTLLTGLNGSGKSSLIQVLLLLRQSKYYLREGILKLRPNVNDRLFDAGAAEDIYYYKATDLEIIFGITYSDDNVLSWKFDYNSDREYSDVLECGKLYKYNEKILDNHQPFVDDNFQYLYAERVIPMSAYVASIENVVKRKTLGVTGEHTAFYLETYGTHQKITNAQLQHPKAKNNSLIAQTNAWLAEISPNISIETKIVSDGLAVDLKYNFGGKAFKPTHVGFGVSYALPVIVALLTAEEGKLIIIENPESHVHPRGQGALGKLLAAATQTGAQIIVETHSDHILNGIRVALKEKRANPDDVIAHYFKKNEEESCSEITSILIDEKGKLRSKTDNGTSAELPRGFFDEWANLMFKLL